MKKLKIVLPALAFLLAIGAAFGTVLNQTAYYDSNGSQPEGAMEGAIDQVDKNCEVRPEGAICTIDGEWAFETEENAVSNQGSQSSPNALGLLKYVP